MENNKRVAFTTLGCKLNFSETSGIANVFEEAGYERVGNGSEADVFVVNTCTVTELANKKSKQAIKKIIKDNPQAKIVAMGCYSQLKPEELSQVEGVDVILGTENKFKVLDYLAKLEKTGKAVVEVDESIKDKSFTPTYSYGDRTRSFLKVQDGCDYYCSYCTIPKARGTSRSNNIEQTVAKAHEVVSKGVKEIILTGVNIGDFGRTTNENFIDLLKGLEEVEGLRRLRISSIEPNLLTPEILEFVSKSEVIVPHFHIPLQCATDNLLRKMRRRYTTNLYEKRVSLIRELMPDACIAADVIVGVPGETEEEFQASLVFLSKIDVSNFHVFTYSEREGTLASKMEQQVPMSERKHRSKIVHQLSDEKKNDFVGKHIGEVRPVLFEGIQESDVIYGFTDNYIKVVLKHGADLENQIQRVKLVEVLEDGNVLAELVV